MFNAGDSVTDFIYYENLYVYIDGGDVTRVPKKSVCTAWRNVLQHLSEILSCAVT